jgi:hypothetical protein
MQGLSILHNKQRTLALLLVILMKAASAHHAPTEFDFDKTVEIEGTIVELKWQNPHVTFKVRENNESAKPSMWEIEGSAVSMLRRTNSANLRPQLQEKVRVAGHPSRRGQNRLYGLNLLLANGEELVFEPDVSRRWKNVAVGNGGVWLDGRAEASGAGIFRVWSTKIDDPWLSNIPEDQLTQAAKDKLSIWNPVSDSVTEGCEPVGVPMLMAQPYPIEFVQKQDRIVLRIELYDLERIIHMDPTFNRESLPSGILGRSTGKWDGNSLVVTTDGITWPFLEYFGTPMSPQSSLLERFTLSPDNKRLNYSVIVTDPMYLTAPVTLERSWIARPNESVKPYKCTN